MLYVCKSCKKIVDTNKHDFCPKCGANFNYSEGLNGGTRTEDYAEYERNREIEEQLRQREEQNRQLEEHNKLLEEQNRQADVQGAQSEPQRTQEYYHPHHNHGATLRAQQYETKRRLQAQQNKHDGKKNGCMGCLAVAALIFFGGTSLVFGGVEALLEDIFEDSEYSDAFSEIGGYVDDYIEDETEDFFTDNEPQYAEGIIEYITDDELITVGINDYADTGRYMFCCNEIREGGVSEYSPNDGKMFVTFHFEMNSICDETMYYYGYPTMYADGEEVNFYPLADEPLFLAGALEPFTSYEGYMTYEVPIDTEVFEITYNNEVKILLKNHLSMQ